MGWISSGKAGGEQPENEQATRASTVPDIVPGARENLLYQSGRASGAASDAARMTSRDWNACLKNRKRFRYTSAASSS